ncbi:PREDICTED: transmembrane protein 14C [Ceratosolen solmsi marchali]|uniref:Transmembrane protein 14C n=1 Tax=Ceratosolen solmsi marchali TaxID=326594 RepID=A0AAJ7DU26_9HYME|nr:PREDICTED: transmembrane protein 14C [Ceratosolen solmsi marchali]
MAIDIPGFAYAAAVGAGGIMGYVKSNSIASITAGLLFSSILGYGAYRTTQDPQNYGIALGTNLILSGMMGYRFLNTGKVMPAGIITVISTFMVIRYSSRIFTSSSIKVQ